MDEFQRVLENRRIHPKHDAADAEDDREIRAVRQTQPSLYTEHDGDKNRADRVSDRREP